MPVDLHTDRRRLSLPYLPGIDALRAVAVMAVLLYHAEVSWLPGGFLGVDVFFVISGYLITALLLTEREATGTVKLAPFWLRRARRLLPALFLLLGVCLAYAVLFLPDEVAGLRGAAVASFGYVTNWFLIFSDQSYFEAFGRPSLFRHLWSLAVEEQFYLFWPLVFAAGMKFFGRRHLLWGVIAGIIGSTALMWVLFEPGQDPSRIYYGSDTRMAGLLCGVALAMVWHPRRLHRQVGPKAPLILDLVGVGALLLLVRQFMVVSEFDESLYRGGFLRISLITTVVLAIAAHPAARFGKVLGIRPMVWIGHRSYSIYLWHWPIFMVTRPRQDIDLDGLPLLALRLALTFAAGALSYRFVEEPIRHGSLARWRANLRAARHSGSPAYQRMAFASFASIIAVVLLAGAVVAADKPPPTTMLASTGASPTPGEAQARSTTTTTTAAPTETSPTTDAVRSGPARTPDTTGATTIPTTAPPTTQPAPVSQVLALGDSVMLGAAPQLSEQFGGNILVDAAVSRPFTEGIWAAQYHRDNGGLPPTIIVHLGNNGFVTDDQFDQLMEVFVDVPNVIFLTVKVNQRWQDPVNATLAAGVDRWPNAHLADWKAISQDHGDFFVSDITHLTASGAQAYAQFVAAQVNP